MFIIDQMFLLYNSNQQNCGCSSFAKSSGIRKSNGLLTLRSVCSTAIDCTTRMNFKKKLKEPCKKTELSLQVQTRPLDFASGWLTRLQLGWELSCSPVNQTTVLWKWSFSWGLLEQKKSEFLRCVSVMRGGWLVAFSFVFWYILYILTYSIYANIPPQFLFPSFSGLIGN